MGRSCGALVGIGAQLGFGSRPLPAGMPVTLSLSLLTSCASLDKTSAGAPVLAGAHSGTGKAAGLWAEGKEREKERGQDTKRDGEKQNEMEKVRDLEK